MKDMFKNKKIIIPVIIFVILVIGLVLFFVLRPKENEKQEISYNAVQLNKYLLRIPEKYNYSFYDDKNMLMIGNKDENWVVYVTLYNSTNRDIFKESEEFQEELKTLEYDVENIRLVDLEITPSITMDFKKEGHKGLLSYIKTKEKYLYELAIINVDKNKELDEITMIGVLADIARVLREGIYIDE